MSVRLCLSLVSAVALSIAIVAQTVNIRPGKYEVTLETEMPGLGKAPPQKRQECVTPDRLKDWATFTGQPEAQLNKQGCKVSDRKENGHTVTFTLTCDKSVFFYEMTQGVDAYSGVAKGKMSGQDITMKMNGKRVGECTP
jgi:hypothetical protein